MISKKSHLLYTLETATNPEMHEYARNLGAAKISLRVSLVVNCNSALIMDILMLGNPADHGCGVGAVKSGVL